MLRSPKNCHDLHASRGRAWTASAGAGRRPGPGARQPRAAARRQLHRHGAGLAGGGQGRLVAVATMPLLRARELGDIIEKSQPALAPCDAKLLDEWSWRSAASGAAAHPVPFNLRCRTGSLADGGAERWPLHGPPHRRPDDIALMAFTSAPPAKPRPPCTPTATCWPPAKPGRAMCCRRHARRHRDGFAAAGLHLRPGRVAEVPDVGRRLGVLPRHSLHAGSHGQAHQRVGATICYTAPTFYRQMAPFARQHGVPTLRICRECGRGPQPTRHASSGRMRPASRCWMASAPPRCSTSSFRPPAARCGVAPWQGGARLPRPKWWTTTGNEVPRGTVGKLAVIGPTGCRTWTTPARANYVKAGWNFPGDAFLQDADGYFFYQARADDDHHRRLQRGRARSGRCTAQAPGGGRVRCGRQT